MSEDKVYDLYKALEKALIIIVGEYPKTDENYIIAIKTAKDFHIDIGENGE